MRPNRVWEYLKLSSRVCVISIFSIFKANKWQTNAGSRLQFLRTVLCEKMLVEGVGPTNVAPFASILGPKFEAILVKKWLENRLCFRSHLCWRFVVDVWLICICFVGAPAMRKSNAMSFATRLIAKRTNLERYCILHWKMKDRIQGCEAQPRWNSNPRAEQKHSKWPVEKARNFQPIWKRIEIWDEHRPAVIDQKWHAERASDHHWPLCSQVPRFLGG